MLRSHFVVLAVLLASHEASAQITTTGPFTGTYTEEFETWQSGAPCYAGRIFTSHADLCSPGMSSVFDTFNFNGLPAHNGSNGLVASVNGYLDYTFDVPAQRFGGYFGSVGILPGGVAKFFDASGALLASLAINAPYGTTMTWNGWDAGSGPGFGHIEIWSNDHWNNYGLLGMDDMEFDPQVPAMTSTCSPGIGGVSACPCANPPSVAGRGCDNSSSTGGALLSAAGQAQIAHDTLVFTTSGEKPNATSILLQGQNASAAGTVFGQGVRCFSGNLKRLYVKAAVGGSIIAPGSGDPGVLARASALGDTISSGDTRYYGVYYRDPTVLGGCPAASTFNITQTGRVQWQ